VLKLIFSIVVKLDENPIDVFDDRTWRFRPAPRASDLKPSWRHRSSCCWRRRGTKSRPWRAPPPRRGTRRPSVLRGPSADCAVPTPWLKPRLVVHPLHPSSYGCELTVHALAGSTSIADIGFCGLDQQEMYRMGGKWTLVFNQVWLCCNGDGCCKKPYDRVVKAVASWPRSPRR
jgi:hypothetical protein